MSKNKSNQNKQYQVFIQKNGGYIEISYEEFCRTQDTIFKDSFFISSHGVLMEVTQEFYQDYHKEKNRMEYLERLDAEFSIDYNFFDTDEFNGEELLIDHDEDVVEQVAKKMMIEKLHSVLPLLDEDEYQLINEHFFLGMSQVELGELYGVNQSNISRKIARILKKLKNFLET